MRQYRDNNLNLADQFSITLQDLERYLQKVKLDFANVMGYYRSSNRGTTRPVNQMYSESETSTNATKPDNPAAKLESEVEVSQPSRPSALHRNPSNRDTRAPAAPTSDKPPFSFNAQSPPPDGVPRAYGPTQVTQDKLTIPPTKKRKVQGQNGIQASTVSQSHGTSISTASPQSITPQSPRAIRNTSTQLLKCPVPSCEAATKGFSNFEDLAKHTKELHKVVEPVIDDPLEWALEGIRSGLRLSNEESSGINKDQTIMGATLSTPDTKQSISVKGSTTLKPTTGISVSRELTRPIGQETLVTTSDTPTGASKSSSTSNDVKRPVNVTDTTGLGNTPSSPPTEPITPSPDPWERTAISPRQMATFFPSAADLQGYVSVAILTPDSIASHTKFGEISPKESDIADGDGLAISLQAESWLPPPFFDDLLCLEVGSYRDDDLLGMEWETTFGLVSTDQGGVDEGKKAVRRARIPVLDTSLFSYNT